MNKQLLTLNSPNLNGRIYKTEEFQAAIDRFVAKGKPMLVQGGYTAARGFSIDDTVGTVENLQIVGDEVRGDIKLFPGKEVFANFACRPACTAKIDVDEDGVIRDICLEYFFFTNDPA